MIKKIFICFTGIDGSGKTTLAKKIVKYLKKYGIDASYLYCGWRNFESPIFLPITNVIKTYSSITLNTNKNSHANQLKNRNSNIFELAVIIDYFFMIIYRLYIPLLFGKTIVSDRYYYDVMINTGIDLKQSPQKTIRLIKIMRPFMPKPSLIFLIDVSPEEAFLRKTDVPDKKFLEKHRYLFKEVAKNLNMITLDGTTSPINLFLEVKKHLNQSALNHE